MVGEWQLTHRQEGIEEFINGSGKTIKRDIN
jgi:hypothetical protein